MVNLRLRMNKADDYNENKATALPLLSSRRDDLASISDTKERKRRPGLILFRGTFYGCCITLLLMAALVYNIFHFTWNKPLYKYSPQHDYHHHQQRHQGGEGEKFLLYLAAGGFSNQLLAMENAAKLALATNRTLVLNPVFPHKTAYHKKHGVIKFPDFPPQEFRRWDIAIRHLFSSYADCGLIREYHTQTHRIYKFVQLLASSSSQQVVKFPSFQHIFDFTNVHKETQGLLRVMDMPDFAAIHGKSNFDDFWCTGKNEKMEYMAIPSSARDCQNGNNNFTLFVEELKAACKDYEIAAWGNGFYLPSEHSQQHHIHHQNVIHDYFTKRLMPSHSLLVLLKEIYLKLPKGYVGVHMRFKDFYKCSKTKRTKKKKTRNVSCEHECQKKEVMQAYQTILEDLDNDNAVHLHKTQNMTQQQQHVLIAVGNDVVIPCFQYHAAARNQTHNARHTKYKVFTIPSIIERNETLLQMLEAIETEKSILYILLEQILIGMAESVHFGLVHVSGSTFQRMIKTFHHRRSELMKSIMIHDGE